jgi:hypothetical protein
MSSIQKTQIPGYTPAAVAGMITNAATLEPANSRAGFTVVTKPCGTGGNPIGRVIDVLKKRDRPDARPPAVCKVCFEAWTHSGRPKLITCTHNRVAALRQAGQWSVATGLTRAQLLKLNTAQGGA